MKRVSGAKKKAALQRPFFKLYSEAYFAASTEIATATV